MKHTMRCMLLLLLACCVPGWAAEASLVWNGVLGNSGEAGVTTVNGATDTSGRGSGAGLVFDPAGTLWALAGPGVLNRYALDGRQLASFRVPRDLGVNNRMALCGKTLVLLLGKQLVALSVDAAAGSSAVPLKRTATLLSFGVWEGKVACYDAERGELFLLDPVANQVKTVLTLPAGTRQDNLELLPQGRIFLGLQEVVDGALKEAPAGMKRLGLAMQWIGGQWFAHNSHGTVSRFDENFSPAPGVIYGGASGSVIAKLDSDEELAMGNGMVQISPELFAVSGMNGTVTILEWNAVTQKLRVVRRIGPFINDFNAIVCNGQQIWVRYGNWEWEDTPEAPLRNGVNYSGDGQLGVWPDGSVGGVVRQYGSRPAWICGSLAKEATTINEKRLPGGLKIGVDGLALVEREKKRVAYLLDSDGTMTMLRVGMDGKPVGDVLPIQYQTAEPVKKWGTLGAYRERLLAVADGAVLELAAKGETWGEVRRWSSWGQTPEERFGREIFLCVDGSDLWVSDTEKHRVLVFDLKGGRSPVFLGTGAAGAERGAFNQPRAISAHGGKAAVIDCGNNRIVKLELQVR